MKTASRWMKRHPAHHLVRAWCWLVAVPVFIFLGWHTSVFVIFLWSSYANFAGDLGAYVAAKNNASDDDDQPKLIVPGTIEG
jgi:hypothetical protein